MSDYKEIPIDKITPSQNNYRQPSKEKMQDLIESVKSKGVIQPILVRPLNGNGTYEIVAGHRRYNAALAAELTELPAIVRELSDEDALELQVIENSQREDPNPMEEAWGFKKLLDLGKHTTDTLAAKIGRSIPYITGRLNLLNLPKSAQKKIADEEISIGHAMLLTRLKNPIQQKELLDIIVTEEMSVKDAKEALDDFSHDIADAAFNTSDCEQCPYLSRNQSILFPELKESSECMDSKCYVKKTRDYYHAVFLQLTAKGFKCITDEEDYNKLRSKGQRITPPGENVHGRYHGPTPKRYKSECVKCTEHHIFFAYDEEDHRHTISIEAGELCLNQKCLNEMQYVKPSNGPSGGNGADHMSEYRTMEKARFCRDRFLRKTLPDILHGPKNSFSDVNRKLTLCSRLLIYHLLDRFKNFPDRSKLLHKNAPGTGGAYSSEGIYHAVNKFPQGNLPAALNEILRATIEVTDPLVLLIMTGEAGIDMSTEFAVDKEFLQGKTKVELIKFVDEQNLEVKAGVNDKKGKIIEAILALDLKGKLPAELVEVCKIEEPDADEFDDGEAVCRVCGCTESSPCEGGCSWVDDPEGNGDLCSACAGDNAKV